MQDLIKFSQLENFNENFNTDFNEIFIE